MISYDERQKLKKKLPISISNGYNLINEKLPNLSRKQIERCFNTKTEKHYREDVIEAALEVVEAGQQKSVKLSDRINSLAE